MNPANIPLTGPANERLGRRAFRALRVVAIGGGTGLSTLLRGLRGHVTPGNPVSGEAGLIRDLAAVVTVTDDGGSSGRLRKGFNMLPPGDLRNCMVALSEEEDVLARLFAHRFRKGDALQGHNFGNLFVAALTEITGDFGHAIQLASKILATRGRIYPVTTANATLVARMDDGSLVRGETNITASRKRIAELMLDPPDAAALAGDAGGHRARRPDYRGAGFAVHLADLQSAGAGNACGAGQGARPAGVHLQPDDPGQREPEPDRRAAH